MKPTLLCLQVYFGVAKIFLLCFSLFYHVFLLYSLTPRAPPPFILVDQSDGQKV